MSVPLEGEHAEGAGSSLSRMSQTSGINKVQTWILQIVPNLHSPRLFDNSPASRGFLATIEATDRGKAPHRQMKTAVIESASLSLGLFLGLLLGLLLGLYLVLSLGLLIGLSLGLSSGLSLGISPGLSLGLFHVLC